MSLATLRQWRLPLLLVLLGLLPIVASLYRIVVLTGTDPASVTNPDELRFFAMPISILLHVIFGVAFLVLGALQFMPKLRIGTPSLHKKIGYIAALSGVIFSLAGTYMVFTYPPHSGANIAIDVGRVILGSLLPLFIGLGIRAATRRNFTAHRAWMIRAYAIAASSGVQSYLVAIAMVLNGGFDVTLADRMLLVGWAVTLVITEWVIARPRLKKSAHPA